MVVVWAYFGVHPMGGGFFLSPVRDALRRNPQDDGFGGVTNHTGTYLAYGAANYERLFS